MVFSTNPITALFEGLVAFVWLQSWHTRFTGTPFTFTDMSFDAVIIDTPMVALMFLRVFSDSELAAVPLSITGSALG